MYDVKPNLVIGFHGCDRAFRDQLLNKPDDIVISKKPFDWLGHVQSEIKENGFSDNKVFDSTRGVFVEGGPAFEGAGIFEKSHIQICIRNLNCIKGFFLPRQEIDFPEWLEKNKAAA